VVTGENPRKASWLSVVALGGAVALLGMVTKAPCNLPLIAARNLLRPPSRDDSQGSTAISTVRDSIIERSFSVAPKFLFSGTIYGRFGTA